MGMMSGKSVVTKAQAEQALNHLFGVWAAEQGIVVSAESDPSFLSFCAWLDQKGYGRYMQFRAVGGPSYAAELWFDKFFKQTWKR